MNWLRVARGEEVERVADRRRAQVLLRDRDEPLADLHQRRRQRRRVARHPHGRGVRGELAVAGQRPAAERADPADQRPPSPRRARAATSPGWPPGRRPRAALRRGRPTTVITAASRLATCASSWAITASSSCGSSRSSRPTRQVQPEAAAGGALDPAVGHRLAVEHERRLGEVGHHAQALDGRVQLRRLRGGEPAPPRGGGDPLADARRRRRCRGESATTPWILPVGEPEHREQRGEHDDRRDQADRDHPEHQPEIGGEEVAARPHLHQYCASGSVCPVFSWRVRGMMPRDRAAGRTRRVRSSSGVDDDDPP